MPEKLEADKDDCPGLWRLGAGRAQGPDFFYERSRQPWIDAWKPWSHSAFRKRWQRPGLSMITSTSLVLRRYASRKRDRQFETRLPPGESLGRTRLNVSRAGSGPCMRERR